MNALRRFIAERTQYGQEFTFSDGGIEYEWERPGTDLNSLILTESIFGSGQIPKRMKWLHEDFHEGETIVNRRWVKRYVSAPRSI